MDAQLIRYLDGELSEAEAAGFLERIDREPELRKALEDEERLLEAARAMPEPTPPVGFTDRVMDAILETDAATNSAPASVRSAASTKPHAARTARPRWAFAFSAAAMILLAFALGRSSVSPPGPGHDAPSAMAGHPVLRPDFASLDTGAEQGLRIVQLVYIPEGNAPAQVAVAGSFSGWQAGKIPMQKQGEVWTATLILPPGSYEYMFLEDETRWVTDPRAPLTRDDGFGGRNAVLDVDA